MKATSNGVCGFQWRSNKGNFEIGIHHQATESMKTLFDRIAQHLCYGMHHSTLLIEHTSSRWKNVVVCSSLRWPTNDFPTISITQFDLAPFTRNLPFQPQRFGNILLQKLGPTCAVPIASLCSVQKLTAFTSDYALTEMHARSPLIYIVWLCNIQIFHLIRHAQFYAKYFIFFCVVSHSHS